MLVSVVSRREPKMLRSFSGVVGKSSVRFREGQCRNRTLPPARKRPDITYSSNFQQVTNGLVVATSLPPRRVLWWPF
jgi:hypothetical protein